MRARLILLVFFLFATTLLPFQIRPANGQGQGGLRFDFQGLTLSPSVGMTEGALKGWHEDDWIPLRLTVINQHSSETTTISVMLEYMNGQRIGIDAFASCFSDTASCGSGTNANSGSKWNLQTIAGNQMNYVAPTVDLVGVAGVTAIRWTLSSISVPEGTPSNPSQVEIRWAVHLAKSGSNNLVCTDSASPLTGCSPTQIGSADGAKSWPGNSLQVRLDQPPGQRTIAIDPPRETEQTGPQCVIATAAFGSQLATPVQFLRDFRDGEVGSTVLGAAFIQGFNNWYYSWAPPVARSIAGNEPAKFAMRALIVPLIGALIIGRGIFAVVSPLNAELGILIAGLASSAIIGTVYLTPMAYLLVRALRGKFGRLNVIFSVLLLGVVLAVCGTLAYGTLGLLQVFSSVMVLESLLLTPTFIFLLSERKKL